MFQPFDAVPFSQSMQHFSLVGGSSHYGHAPAPDRWGGRRHATDAAVSDWPAPVGPAELLALAGFRLGDD